MKKVLALVLVCVLALGAIACGTKTETPAQVEATTAPEQPTEPEVTAEPEQPTQPEVTAEPEQTEEPAEDDGEWAGYPKKLADWSLANLKDYLRTAGIIVDGDSNMMAIDMSANELEATGLTAGFIYTNISDGSIVDMFMEARTEALLSGLRSEHSIAGAIPMDGMLGNFAFSYSGGYNDEHIAALKKAIEDLGAHYGETADLWN